MIQHNIIVFNALGCKKHFWPNTINNDEASAVLVVGAWMNGRID